MPKNKIVKLKDGRFEYSVTDKNGKRWRIKSRKDELKRAFSKRCDELDRRAEYAISQDSFSSLFSRWMEEYVKVKLSPAETRVLLPIYTKYIDKPLGKLSVTEIKQADVYAVLAAAEKKNLSPAYIRKIRSCVSRPYNWAINALGMDIPNPTANLRYKAGRQREEGRERVMSREDLRRVLDAARGTKYENYFRVLSATGMRPSEALGLQAKDITFGAKGYISVRRAVTIDGMGPTKTRAGRREIPITPELNAILRAQVEKYAFATASGWLFPSESGEPSMNAINSAFKRILKRTEAWQTGGRNGQKKLKILIPAVECSIYDFRHTVATRLAEAGINPKMLQRILGHETISVTLKYYIGVTDTMIEEARSAMSSVLVS